MRGRGWVSFKLFGPVRLIASRTGVRPAIRTRHMQVSTRSAFAHYGPLKYFLALPTRRHLTHTDATSGSWLPSLFAFVLLGGFVTVVLLVANGVLL